MDLKDLKKEIPFKWRVQSFSKFKPQATCVAYIDARDVMDLLDDVCGPDKWQDDYRDLAGGLLAGIGIHCEDGWVWKWNTGTESNMEKEKGQVSDAFKRAAVKWGVGRFLYRKKIVYVDANEIKVDPDKSKGVKGTWPYVIDSNGKRVWNLTEHINNMGKQGKKKVSVTTITIDQLTLIKDLIKEAKFTKEQDKKMMAWNKLSYNPDSLSMIAADDYNIIVNFLGEKIKENAQN